MSIENIEKIMSLEHFQNQGLWSFENLSFNDYKKFIKKTITDFENDDLRLTQVHLFSKIITNIFENKLFVEQSENFHLQVLINFLDKYNEIIKKETSNTIFSCVECAQILVDTLSNTLSLEKLNYYNQETNKSVLKSLLSYYANVNFLPSLHQKGLVISHVDGLNPYYYVLRNCSSLNYVIEQLFYLETPLPNNYWSYVFRENSYKKIEQEKTFLLTLPDKEFIVDYETNECVWNLVIKNKSYHLIEFIPQDFYKPHHINGKSLFQLMVESNDFTILEHLKLDVVKLLDNSEDLLSLFLIFLKTEKNRKLFIIEFLPKMIELYPKIKTKESATNALFDTVSQKWLNASHYSFLNKLTTVSLMIASYIQENDSLYIPVDNVIDYANHFHDLDNLIKIYKNRRDFPNALRENILKYINSLKEIDINKLTLVKDEELYKKHQIILEKIAFSQQYKDKQYYLSDELLENILKQLDETTIKNLYQEMINYIDSFNFPNLNSMYENLKTSKENLLKSSYIDIFSQAQEENVANMIANFQHEENNNLCLNEINTNENFIKIELLSGSSKQAAQEAVNDMMEDMKAVSRYPSETLSKISIDDFITHLKALGHTINIEEVYIEEKEINEVQTSEQKNKDVTSEKQEKEQENPIPMELFSTEEYNKFKRENEGLNNEVISNFLRKNPNSSNIKIKTLAKADTLLSTIDSLYETFPHFQEVIKHIENLMILQNKGDKSFYIPPLLLGGGPGVGKTFFCSTISKLVHTHFELLNMESMTASFILTGGNAQWSNATPGKIFKALFNSEHKNMNPIFLLDELEKAGGDSRYSVMNSLLPLLERYTAKTFKDECIPLPIDASYIIWIATANDLDKLTAPIRSRFDIFSIPNPTPTQRKSLIKGIYKTVRENNTWGHHFSEQLPDETLDVLANLMAPGAARDLRKSITLACSKAIREEQSIILPHHIERYEQSEVMPWNVIV